MRAFLTKRNGFRLRAWQAGLVAVIFVMAFGMIRSGASWGSSGYDPASDPYSMQNITAADGAQAWWKSGYTGQGVDVALIDTGVSPVAGLNCARQGGQRAGPLARIAESRACSTSTRTATARSWPG